MTLEEFVEKHLEPLGRVEHHGSYYKARCPAHEDQTPSLKVSVNENGWIDPHCFTGCTKDDILTALGLENRDLSTGALNYAEPLAIYPYVDEQGTELFQQVRFPPKRFRSRHLDENSEWVYSLDGVRRVLYRLPEVIEAVSKGEPVYIVEGEKDADNLIEHLRVKGLPGIATCNPGGAGKWKSEYNECLAGANVVIWADRDGPGRNHAQRVQTSLQGTAAGIWAVQSRRGKDVTDHLEAGLGLEDYEPMSKRTRRGLITANEMADAALEELELREHDIPGYVLSSQVPVTFRQGRVYAIGAYTGHGKTSFALPGLRNLCTQGVRCGYFSNEMPERDLRNKLIAHKGLPLSMTEEPWKIAQNPEALALYKECVEEIRGWDVDVMFDSNIDAENILKTVEDREHEVVFVDHIHRFGGATDRQKMSEQVTKLTNMALELNVCVILLCQLRKFQRGNGMMAYPRPTLQDFRETSSIGDDSSMALAIWRQTDEAGTSFTGQTMTFILKNRHTTGAHDAAGRGYYLHFDPQREMFVPQPGGVQVVHEEENGHIG